MQDEYNLAAIQNLIAQIPGNTDKRKSKRVGVSETTLFRWRTGRTNVTGMKLKILKDVVKNAISNKDEPCPFCSSTDTVIEYGEEKEWVKCNNCEATGPKIKVPFYENGHAETHEKWNERKGE